ncbi:MAG TPA: hypothetical protein DGG95_12970 [Cytophagales bacterium]|nr:hypothetical protein [Cytophagales bacterium]
MTKPIKFLLLICWLIAPSAKGQDSLDSLHRLPDSVKAFTLDEFYTTILEFHPIVKQTRLLRETAQAEIRLARGAFDPKIETKFNNKEFNGKEYYSKWNSSLSLPSWFPIDPKIGIEQNTGLYIDPENSVPAADKNRQIFTGISLPLGRGLFTDDRRTTLKTAKVFAQIAEAEQIRLINKILLEAAKDYWQWYFSYYNYRLMQRNVRVASEIFERVKLNAVHGEASVIDTVQAKITWIQRSVEKQEAYLEFINSGIRISNYLWDNASHAIQLSPRIAPVLQYENATVLQLATLESLREQAKENHPELRKLNLKLNQLDFEKKLAAEYLKPRLDLNYNFLNQPVTPQGKWNTFNFNRNYKFGLDFSIPVFLRKERAKYAQAKIKIKGTNYELDQTEREIINQVNTVFNQLKNTNIILSQQKTMVINYERLLKAEILNLENGESDLFKINVQQEKLIQSQSKLLKLKSEYEKLKAQLYWAAGVQNLSMK